METVYNGPRRMAEYKGIKFYMYDLLSPDEELSLVQFIQDEHITILGENNSKIKGTQKAYNLKSATVDLLAGHTCPAANLCHSRVITNQDGSRVIQDLGKFRCYATKSEALYTAVYKLHERNKVITELESFPLIMTYIIRVKRLQCVRIHSSGDYYDFEYFKKWILIAQMNPSVIFFGYTKQATFVNYLRSHPVENYKIVYSYGGIHDGYAIKQSLPSCTVVTDDYLYHAHNTTIQSLDDGSYLYTYIVGKNRNGTNKTVQHTSSLYLEYGTYYNPIKQCVENLSCLHDSERSKVDDFERIMRQESFGIIFH